MKNTYKPGQIWSYNTRDGEDESAILVLKVENYKDQGITIHIAVNNVKISNSEGIVATYISHLPFTNLAIDRSITDLIADNVELPDFSEEYNEWKEAFDQGSAVVFSIDICEAIDIVEKSIQE